MRAERGAVYNKWSLRFAVFLRIGEAKPPWLGKVHLVCGESELAANGAPDLHVYFRPVERRFVWHFDKRNFQFSKHIAHHILGLFPKLWFVHKLFAKFFGVMS